jgi:hypothetical protein
MVKDNRWNSKDLIDWLLDCDVHFIINHIHQGLVQVCWYMEDLYLQLPRLYHWENWLQKVTKINQNRAYFIFYRTAVFCYLLLTCERNSAYYYCHSPPLLKVKLNLSSQQSIRLNL